MFSLPLKKIESESGLRKGKAYFTWDSPQTVYTDTEFPLFIRVVLSDETRKSGLYVVDVVESYQSYWKLHLAYLIG
jgi:hypothetical protein